jgi:hypothetical protein
MKKPRRRKCKNLDCRIWFKPTRENQVVCSPECAYKKTIQDKAKKQAKEHREAKRKLKPRGKWIKEAQTVFNTFIRLRDKDFPCISCGNHHEGQYHAGHFYTTAARPDLRFNEDNCNKQCSICNNHKSGNINEYRASLVEKIGKERLDALGVVGRSDWSIDEIKEIKAKYQAEIKHLKESEKFYKDLELPF